MLSDVKLVEGYPEPYGLLCAILQDGSNEWRRELDLDVPEEAVIWQAEPGGHSIGGIILHIAAVEVFWFETFALGLIPDPNEERLLMDAQTQQYEWKWPTPPRQPLSWYFELHDRIRARTLESIKRWPSAETAIALHGEPRTLRWVLGHVIQHEAYHGGQAVLLNRLWWRQQTKA